MEKNDPWFYQHPNQGWMPCTVCDALTALAVGWQISLGIPATIPSYIEQQLEGQGYDPKSDFSKYTCDCGGPSDWS